MSNTPRPTFHAQVFQKLQETIKELGGEVPELEAVGVVLLWRFKDQTSIPAIMVQGTTGPVANPDQLLRLHLTTLELERFCVDQSARSIVAIQQMAETMARQVRQAREPQKEATQDIDQL